MGYRRTIQAHGPLIRLRPRHDTLHVSRNRTVLATAPDGFIPADSVYGLVIHETRVLSHWRWRIHNRRPKPIALSNVEQHSWLGYYVAPIDERHAFELEGGEGAGQGSPMSAEETIELRLARFVGDGMHEHVRLTNYSRHRAEFELELELDADFADLEEVGRRRLQRGRRRVRWIDDEPGVRRLRFDYQASHAFDNQGERGTATTHRAVTLRIFDYDSEPILGGSRIRFPVRLPPRSIWQASIDVIPEIEGEPCPPQIRRFGEEGRYDQLERRYLQNTTAFSIPGDTPLAHVVVESLEQAKRDLSALRLFDLDHGDRAWTVAAGLPVYVSLFGRDTLTVGWEAALASPDILRGTLPELARWQGTEVNDWRDEQPGRMIHEAHTGPLEVLNYNPRARSYGSVTTSAFFPVVLSEMWHWTGDRQAVAPLIEPALRALRWLDEWGDADGRGFYTYQTRSRMGVRNQAWKDSESGIVDENGDLADPPLGACEEQGFAYLAKLHLSEVLWWFDRKDEARALYDQAAELKKRFNEAFWMEDEGFYALALNGDGRQVRAITSNPGHCLATAIVDDSLARRAADRLLAPDLFTGWGLRTLSSHNPAYNPYSYHRGSVWPVEHGSIAIGLARYGFFDHVHALCKGMFEAASLFDFYRLPECFAGHQRDEQTPFPAIYPKANWPQAWSSSALFCMFQTLLGLYPYAPLRLLLVDPHLPEWLPEITLRNLRVGDGRVTIRFRRKESGESTYEVLERRGVHVLWQPSPWSLTANWAERLRDALVSVLPRK